MIPSYYMDLAPDFEITNYPTRTYKIKFDGTPSAGMLEGAEAMKQAVYLILNAERFRFEMFSWDYGVELSRLFEEQNDALVLLKVQEAIRSALMQDDRIDDVSGFSFNRPGKQMLHVSFNVFTTEGEIYGEIKFNNGRSEVII